MVRVVPTTLKQLISYVLPEGWLIIAKEGNVLADKWKSKRIFTPRWWRNPSASQGFSFCPCTDQLNKGLLHQLHRRAHAGARTYVYFPSFQPVLASEDTDRFRWVLACKGVQKKKKKKGWPLCCRVTGSQVGRSTSLNCTQQWHRLGPILATSLRSAFAPVT